MKKTIAFACKALAAGILVASPLAVASCGDDDDDATQQGQSGTTGDRHPAKVEYSYNVEVTDAWLDLFDVVKTTVTPYGAAVTDTLYAEAESGSFNIEWASVPSMLKVYVVAKPKKNLDELVSANEDYDMSYYFKCTVTGLTEDGKESPFSLPSSGVSEVDGNGLIVRGADMRNFAAAMGDTIFKAEYVIK